MVGTSSCTHERQSDTVTRHDHDAVSGVLVIDVCHLSLRSEPMCVATED